MEPALEDPSNEKVTSYFKKLTFEQLRLVASSLLRRWAIVGIAVAIIIASITNITVVDASQNLPDARNAGRSESLVPDTPSRGIDAGVDDFAPTHTRRHLLAPTCQSTSSIMVRSHAVACFDFLHALDQSSKST